MIKKTAKKGKIHNQIHTLIMIPFQIGILMLTFYDESNLVPNITYVPTIRAGIGVLRIRRLVIRRLVINILYRINQSKTLDKSKFLDQFVSSNPEHKKSQIFGPIRFSLQTNGQEPVLKQLQQGRVEAATLLSRSRKSESTFIHVGKE